MLRDRGLVTSKILKIRGDSDIVLENGDILFETDLVKVIPVTKCSKSPIFKQMNEHIFVFGDLSTTQVTFC